MPSPTRPIQLNAVESDWFKLVDGDDGRTLLPSIKEGSSVTINSSIKVRIREREEYESLEVGAIFTRREAIQLRATMPWIERDIPKFDSNMAIDIRYPCELRNIQALATVAQASLSKLSFEVCTYLVPRFSSLEAANITKRFTIMEIEQLDPTEITPGPLRSTSRFLKSLGNSCRNQASGTILLLLVHLISGVEGA